MTFVPLKVLILCTGNSCRSILGEALFNHLGKGRVTAFSAGSKPKMEVHPKTLSLLQSRGISTARLRSKSWNEFAGISFDAVITVCDAAAGESCPIFPGSPVKVHWGIPDPDQATGSEEEISAAFERAYNTLEARVKAFLDLPHELTGNDLEICLRSMARIVAE